MNTIKQKDVQEKKGKVFISFVLDESGSMSTGKDAIVSGMNEQIQTLKSKFKDGQAEVVVSFVKFADNIISLYEGKTLEDLKEFESHAYKPNGSTALYDAVGYTMDMMGRMDGINDEGNSSLVVVYTDGEENASKHFNAKQIAEKIQSLQNTKRWTITYLGPNNVDLSKVKQSISTSYGNMYSADLTSSKGYTAAFRQISSSLDVWADNASFAVASGVSYCSDSFYALDKKPTTTANVISMTGLNDNTTVASNTVLPVTTK
jgi:uncharacterized protein YegL